MKRPMMTFDEWILFVGLGFIGAALTHTFWDGVLYAIGVVTVFAAVGWNRR